MPAASTRLLATPPIPRLVAAEVFDGFGWCDSDRLEWRCPEGRWDGGTPIDGSDPARMVFVFSAECTFLPRELGRLHAFGLGLTDEWALSPYAIDDATDELYARRVRPRDLLWLAADNLNALYWGLHDWAHFHNHGPFERRAENELQCDAAALAWLWRNRRAIPLGDDPWERLRAQAAALAEGRYQGEGRDGAEARAVLAAPVLRALGEDAREPSPP